jgi:drug/metabolite transporter (DMT)-like permease
MKHSTPSAALTHIMLLAAALFWGTNPMVMKLGLRNMAPFPFNTLRIITAILIAAPITLFTRSWKRIDREDLLRMFAIPAVGFLLFQFFFTFGVAASTASVAAIVLAILPIAVAVISHVFRFESLTRAKAVGVFATFAGVIFIAFGTPEGFSLRGTQVYGVALLVMCEIGYGLYTVCLKPLTAKYPVPQITLLMLMFTLIPFAGYTLVRYGFSVYRNMEPLSLGAAVFSGLFALVLSNMLWTTGIKRLGSLSTSVYGNLQPVFGVASGILILGEQLGLIQIAGAFVVLAGILAVNRRKPR